MSKKSGEGIEGELILASDIAAKGGRARAAKLSPEAKRGIAQKAAMARWDKASAIPKATHGDPDHPLRIAGLEIGCYVLDNGQRVISQRGMQSGIGMNESGGARRLLKILGGFSRKGLDCKDLTTRILNPVVFKPTGGGLGHGYEASVLADLCDVILAARKADHLQKQQLHIADRCEVLIRGFARVGLIALIDEATGYQDVRDRQALQEILDKFLRKEFAAWAKTFPDDFYQEIFRLRGWKWRGMKVNRPQCVAQYTKDLVYARLTPGILSELETRNPMLSSGRRQGKHFQLLTQDFGHPALAQHLHAILGLMRAVDSWPELMKMVNRAFPKRGDTLQLELFRDEA